MRGRSLTIAAESITTDPMVRYISFHIHFPTSFGLSTMRCKSIFLFVQITRWHAVIFGNVSSRVVNSIYKQGIGLWLDEVQWVPSLEAISKIAQVSTFFQPPSGITVVSLPPLKPNEFSLQQQLDRITVRSIYFFIHVSQCNIGLAKRMYRIQIPLFSASSMVLPEPDAPLSASIQTNVQFLDQMVPNFI